jgi:hypothetical protein
MCSVLHKVAGRFQQCALRHAMNELDPSSTAGTSVLDLGFEIGRVWIIAWTDSTDKVHLQARRNSSRRSNGRGQGYEILLGTAAREILARIDEETTVSPARPLTLFGEIPVHAAVERHLGNSPHLVPNLNAASNVLRLGCPISSGCRVIASGKLCDCPRLSSDCTPSPVTSVRRAPHLDTSASTS